MVRGMVVIMTLMFEYIRDWSDVIMGGAVVGLVAFIIGIYSTVSIPETHDRDLDFLEE